MGDADSLIHDRRGAPRWSVDHPLEWRVHAGRRIRRARVVERSLTGLVMLTPEDDRPRVGDRVHPADRATAERRGFRCGEVARVEDAGAGWSRVIVSILG